MADLAHIRDKMEKIRNQLSGLPVFTIGLLRSRSAIRERPGFLPLLSAGHVPKMRSIDGLGRAVLLVGLPALRQRGLEILGDGVEEILFRRICHSSGSPPMSCERINPRLLPPMAHDRARVARADFTTGFTRCARLGRRRLLSQVLP